MRRAVMFALVGLIASLLPATAGGQAEPNPTTFRTTFLVGGPFWSQCTGEYVLLSGYLHYVEHHTVARDGTLRTASHINSQGIQGVGETSGTRYVLQEVRSFIWNSSGSPPLEFTSLTRQPLISQGSAPNLTLSIKIHTTINAQGEVTVSFERIEVGCG